MDTVARRVSHRTDQTWIWTVPDLSTDSVVLHFQWAGMATGRAMIDRGLPNRAQKYGSAKSDIRFGTDERNVTWQTGGGQAVIQYFSVMDSVRFRNAEILE